MSSGMGLHGKWIAQRIRRWLDQRAEARRPESGSRVTLGWRGQSVDAGLGNLSSSGAMVICGEVPHIGERVSLVLPDRSTAIGDVSWVRDGQIGIHFAPTTE